MDLPGLPSFRLRPVVLPDDAEALWTFARDAHGAYMRTRFLTREQHAERLARHFDEEPEGMRVVVDAGERPVGFLHLATRSHRDDGGRPVAHLHEVYVVPELRRRGIGRALLAIAEAVVREKAMAAVELHVFEENGRAIALYEREGWTTRSTREIFPGGPRQRLMMKKL